VEWSQEEGTSSKKKKGKIVIILWRMPRGYLFLHRNRRERAGTPGGGEKNERGRNVSVCMFAGFGGGGGGVNWWGGWEGGGGGGGMAFVRESEGTAFNAKGGGVFGVGLRVGNI